jgi:hypothetical protein
LQAVEAMISARGRLRSALRSTRGALRGGWRGAVRCLANYPEGWTPLAEKELRGKPLDSLQWHTPEGITIKPLYSQEDVKELKIAQGEACRGWLSPSCPPMWHHVTGAVMFNSAWAVPLHAGAVRDHVYGQALDHPAVCGLLHGGGVQRLLPQVRADAGALLDCNIPT